MVFPLYYVTSCSVLHAVPYRRSRTQVHLKRLFSDAGSGRVAAAALGVGMQRGGGLGSCQESISKCVPEVYWFFLPWNLDNQIYPLIAKVMPLLVTRS